MNPPTWNDLLSQLISGNAIPYWRPRRRNTDGTFTIDEITDETLRVTTKSGTQLSIRQRDYEETAPLLDSYSSGELKGTDLKSRRRYYIFSLIHHFNHRGSANDPSDRRTIEADPNRDQQLSRLFSLLRQRVEQGGTIVTRKASVRVLCLIERDLLHIWKGQRGQCALCQAPIPLQTENPLLQISADRINSENCRYDLTNTQLTHLGCNLGKNEATPEIFHEWLAVIRGHRNTADALISPPS